MGIEIKVISIALLFESTKSLLKMKAVFLVALLVALVASSPAVHRLRGGPLDTSGMLCDICIQLVTEFDAWLTDDKTEQDIVVYVEQVCDGFDLLMPGMGLGDMCRSMIEDNLPNIIDGLVNNNLKPQEVCHSIAMC